MLQAAGTFSLQKCWVCLHEIWQPLWVFWNTLSSHEAVPGLSEFQSEYGKDNHSEWPLFCLLGPAALS